MTAELATDIEAIEAGAIRPNVIVELPAYDFVVHNSLFYRVNKQTGESWKLETDPQDRKVQRWVPLTVKD